MSARFGGSSGCHNILLYAAMQHQFNCTIYRYLCQHKTIFLCVAAGLSKPMKTQTVIKKYGNRRLYDTAAKRYVNLDDIARLIRQGAEVKVVDATTGEDLTRVTLTQIITEDAKDRPTGLPLELLRQLIVASDHARQEFIMWYLKSAFDTYQTVKDAVENRLANMQSTLLSPADAVKRFMATASPPSTASSASELEVLRQQVANLEARLKKPRPKKARRKKT